MAGRPTSSNRASSFHLWWDLRSGGPLVEVSAVLEVVEPPAVDRLYFWALQVGFADRAGSHGGAHIGLQWNPRHPGHGAVNWGGYDRGGNVLEGSASTLPSARNDRNTRDYPWRPARAYQVRVFPTPGTAAAWRGEITDLAARETTVVRDLYGGGEFLGAPVVWSEVFADCDHPSVTVRWSDMRAVTAAGTVVVPAAARVNYQSYANGGCDNTNASSVGGALLQTTGTVRTTRQGALLRL